MTEAKRQTEQTDDRLMELGTSLQIIKKINTTIRILDS
jgi:hypothetical protein